MCNFLSWKSPGGAFQYTLGPTLTQDHYNGLHAGFSHNTYVSRKSRNFHFTTTTHPFNIKNRKRQQKQLVSVTAVLEFLPRPPFVFMLGWSFKPVNLLALPPRDQQAIFCFSKQVEVSTISLYLIGPCWHSTSRVDIPYWPIMFLSLLRQTSFCRLIFFWLSVCFLFVGTITESKPSLDNFPPGVLIWPRLNYSIWTTVSADLVT